MEKIKTEKLHSKLSAILKITPLRSRSRNFLRLPLPSENTALVSTNKVAIVMMLKHPSDKEYNRVYPQGLFLVDW